MAQIRRSIKLQRREFLIAGTGALGWLLLPRAFSAAQPGVPTDNSVGHLKLAWTDRIQWGNVVDVTRMVGQDIVEQLAKAQAQLAAKGGGVVYFPPGVYRFTDSIRLKNGIVLRGANPPAVTKAIDERYDPPSKLEFPQYVFRPEGNGTPMETAFKGIHLENPATDCNCGVVT